MENNENPQVPFDLSNIFQKDTLVALTGYNAYSYFVYQGKPMGYEYELLKRFAKILDVELQIIVLKDINKMFEYLNKGKGDLIAFNLTVDKERTENYHFTETLNYTKQVLIQRKPKNWQNLTKEEITKQLILNIEQMKGKTVVVTQGSVYSQTLKKISTEIKSKINIKLAKNTETTEDLIKQVSEGKIDFTIADENIANLFQAYYADIDISLELTIPQRIAWAVRQTSDTLLTTLNNWLENEKHHTTFYAIYDKYYKNRNAFQRRFQSDYFSKTGRKISIFDNLIKKYAKLIDWDWKIIAALIYEESQFDPSAKSWVGAVGLMQLMPFVAEEYGVTDLEDPNQNIKAGVSYLKLLNEFWSRRIKDDEQRIKFVLASYNIGYGHILDARNLANKYGADPNVWENSVEVFLLKKSNPEFYNDEVVKNGFALGKETVKFVREVLQRFNDYKKHYG